ncbi:glycosyltransferase family 4 protein [Riemerella anatipestifer]|uniref:Glycosyltransferase family 1 protein n=1 Tax=Riemerella anatipestifer TaxID=34085 RepID=A0AAP6HHC6_RIEAN|nr:glycosyltransferase family 1 protein [Riemerella anatipestifer]MBT0573014.1 glycosyltransferase family 4 protein [Riemerella anatipestifer]MCU7573705.1 glycosyltransferase family 4 protein [Riemerella anatipestifer]MCU7594865.1 glycosyltransferase family 4 protein [Riemerella anatipestifer]MCW0486122.1 glycosyltransferase family 4 protein [Riemerella anatipestifer]MCW0489196.1 glycosyltransferase family 4 protein [Riemerella anatipestifer]
MIKIVLDNIVFSLQKSGGVSTLWYELIRKLLENNEFDVFFLEYEGASNNLLRSSFEIPKEKILNVSTQSNLFIERYKNVKLNIKEPFLFISSYYRVCKNPNAKNITIVHDFTYEYYRKGLARLVHSYQKRKAVLSSDGVISISKNTEADLHKFIPSYKKKIKIIYNGVSEKFYLLQDKERLANYRNSFQEIIEKKVLLYIGHRTSYKNFDKVVEAYKKLKDSEYFLVIVGEKFNKKEEKFIESQIRHGTYILYSRLGNEELNYLYNIAFALLYPSSYEGFGIPLVEAMRAGCPSIALNKSSIPEVVGNACILMQNADSEQIVEAVNSLNDLNFRNDLINRGFIQSQKFSWDITTSKYLAFFQELSNDIQ